MIDRPLETFSVAFKQRAFSELDYARQVATAIKANPHEIVIDDTDFFGALPQLVWHEDEPIAHPSSVPLYFVSKLARRARQGGADRRRQRRAAGRLRQIPARAGQLARRRVSGAWRRSRSATFVSNTVAAAPARPRGALRATVVPRRCRGRPRRCSSTTSRRSAWRGRPRCSIRASPDWRRRSAYGASRAYFDAPNGEQHHARSAALRGPQDLPGRTADEAGPDEHGGLDREPRALPGSPPRGVRGRAASTDETARPYHQVDPA